MDNRLHRVAYYDDDSDYADFTKIEYVKGLGKQIVFEKNLERRKAGWIAKHQSQIIDVFSKGLDVKLSTVEVQNSVWKYDTEKKHILLEKQPSNNMISTSLVDNLGVTNDDIEPENDEDLQKFLETYRPQRESLQERIRNGTLTAEDRVFLMEEMNSIPTIVGLPVEQDNQQLELVNDKPKLPDSDREKSNIEAVRSHKKQTVVGFWLLFGGALVFYAVLFFNQNIDETARVIQTLGPSQSPTEILIEAPTLTPTLSPTASPTTDTPTNSPLPRVPTFIPTMSPTLKPTTGTPTSFPSNSPTFFPTTPAPTHRPSNSPTLQPTNFPSASPTSFPTTLAPTVSPSKSPTQHPTSFPSVSPTGFPTTLAPTVSPTKLPTQNPTNPKTNAPTSFPTTGTPTGFPTNAPSLYPTTLAPTLFPTTSAPTDFPTSSPTLYPTTPAPTLFPTSF